MPSHVKDTEDGKSKGYRGRNVRLRALTHDAAPCCRRREQGNTQLRKSGTQNSAYEFLVLYILGNGRTSNLVA